MNIDEPTKLTPDPDSQRRQELTQRIRQHAAGARTRGLHRIRVGHAVECGQALAQLKDLLRHGDWERWITEECAINRATANRYMRLASNVDRLTRYMTLRQAYIAAGVINSSPRAVPHAGGEANAP